MKELHTSDYAKDGPPLNLNDIGAPEIEPQEVMRMAEIELEAFMNEPVEIYVHESNDEHAARVEYLAVEGRRQYVIRGKPQVVKRKYVERLARARKTTYRQDLSPKDESLNNLQPNTAPMLPFTVRKDTPKGLAWLDCIMREAA